MIGTLRGKIIFYGEKHVILDVAGVGYKVYALPFTIQAIAAKQGKKDEAAIFWTHLYVRENALDLYGFAERAEVEFFEALISISGIGPKSATGVMSVAPLDTLKMAIASGETSYLSKVSGIGRKTAEKIIVEL
ncbi:MAG: Holliday junction branch migration protein RuvA, partial [Patescibacteria group bacterium]